MHLLGAARRLSETRMPPPTSRVTEYRTISVDGLDVF